MWSRVLSGRLLRPKLLRNAAVPTMGYQRVSVNSSSRRSDSAGTSVRRSMFGRLQRDVYHTIFFGPCRAKAALPATTSQELTSIPKIVKCYQIKHFLDLLGICAKNAQPNKLIPFEIKKSVSLV